MSNLAQIIGILVATRPAVPTGPLHYLVLQDLKIRTLPILILSEAISFLTMISLYQYTIILDFSIGINSNELLYS